MHGMHVCVREFVLVLLFLSGPNFSTSIVECLRDVKTIFLRSSQEKLGQVFIVLLAYNYGGCWARISHCKFCELFLF